MRLLLGLGCVLLCRQAYACETSDVESLIAGYEDHVHSVESVTFDVKVTTMSLLVAGALQKHTVDRPEGFIYY